VFRLLRPGMPRQHFFPRQSDHPKQGPVQSAKLKTRHEGDTRIVEAVIPWSEIPKVCQRMQQGEPLKFAFRTNDNKGPSVNLNVGRSVAEGVSPTFHPDWSGGQTPNMLEFGWAKRNDAAAVTLPIGGVGTDYRSIKNIR
jgi:hypothetical protein